MNTPRTDALWQNAAYDALRNDHKISKWSDFARQLETELAAVKADYQKSDERWIARENELMGDSARWKHLWQEVTKERDAMKHALIELEAAAESYAADQSGATDRRCGLVQPITVEDGNRLLSALRIANELTK